MDATGWTLPLAAAAIAVTHTALGPDHYLPFVMLARARGWSRTRTAWITAVCGIGHVASSLLLATIGLALGAGVARLESWELGRGNLAGWCLVAFGLAYASWGVRKAFRRRRGFEPHRHDNHVHLHGGGDRPHRHAGPVAADATFWTLFALFVLGPCEPLIPLFVLPASRGEWLPAALAAAVFGVATIGVMVGLTLVGLAGVSRLRFERFAEWSHALAGGIIAAAGVAVVTLGV
ncbi:MAG: sulfite exporter TauE/SafE family protein [Planctomycetota bacterium]|jgi:hypothetical protein